MSSLTRESPAHTPPRQPIRLLLGVSLIAVLFVILRTWFSNPNIAYWDEVDSAIAFLLRLDSGMTWSGFIDHLFSVTNEHRTVTSRMIFALSYLFSGTVNFTVIGWIGNAFFLGLCAVLIRHTEENSRRVRMAVLLALVVFQLEHFENFLWSGSSIDHFQVVLLVAASLTLLVRTRPSDFGGSLLFAMLASLTLAHGLAVWPIGAIALWQAQRRRQLLAWIGTAAVVAAIFLYRYQLNPGHHIGDWSVAGPLNIAWYWLSLLGAPAALGDTTVAPFMGVALLALLALRTFQAAPVRERWLLPLAWWAVLSLLLVAVGRTAANGGYLYSRYYILGSLAWCLALFTHFDAWYEAARPYHALVRALPVLILFNLAANIRFTPKAQMFEMMRDNATRGFVLHGRDGTAPHTLHPNPKWASDILRQAEERNVYRMPRSVKQTEFTDIKPATAMSYFVDNIQVDERMIEIRGWAGVPGRPMQPGDIHLVLKSSLNQRIFTTLPLARPDVAAAYSKEKWLNTGFQFRRRRWLLPPTLYQVGFLIKTEKGPEMVMTAHQLDLRGKGRGIVAAAD